MKLKNLNKLFESKVWEPIKGKKDIDICAFTYKAHGWSKSRTLKAIRSVKEYVEVEYLGEKSIVSVYQYACYISSYDVDAVQLHEIYKQRSLCDTWIEQVKGQAMAGATLTDDFWANDILWQLFQKLRVKWSLLQFYRNKKIISLANWAYLLITYQ